MAPPPSRVGTFRERRGLSGELHPTYYKIVGERYIYGDPFFGGGGYRYTLREVTSGAELNVSEEFLLGESPLFGFVSKAHMLAMLKAQGRSIKAS